jgi:hypothetical protein
MCTMRRPSGRRPPDSASWFSLPSGIRGAFPDADGTQAEIAWSALHGLATLQASGRLRASQAQARRDLAHRMLTQQETH